MRRDAHVIAGFRVRSEFGATLRPSPVLGRGHQGGADPALSRLRHHVPSLEKRDSIGLASFGIGANRQLGETGWTSILLPEEHSQRFAGAPREKPFDVCPVIFNRDVRPEIAAEP